MKARLSVPQLYWANIKNGAFQYTDYSLVLRLKLHVYNCAPKRKLLPLFVFVRLAASLNLIFNCLSLPSEHKNYTPEFLIKEESRVFLSLYIIKARFGLHLRRFHHTTRHVKRSFIDFFSCNKIKST